MALSRDVKAGHRVDTGAGETSFFDLGPRDAPVLLFVHGWASIAAEVLPLAERLGRDFRLIAPNWPGIEGSSPLAVYSMRALVDWLEEFSGRLGLASFALAGHSLGGHLALRFALAHPERVSRLVLLAPAGITGEEGKIKARAAKRPLLVRLMLALMGPGVFAFFSYAGIYHRRPRADHGLIAREARAWTSPQAKSVLAAITLGVLDTDMVESDLRGVKPPTLLIWGREDRLLPFRHAKTFLERLPAGAALAAIEGCGHVAHLEKPDETSRAIAEFLSSSC
jgi:pimeloyl-ACP methyl ester carboxylesterase